jgi:hypothetical protein
MLLSEYDESDVELATLALNRILKFHHDREFVAARPTPPNNLLHHYTTADGIKGIIEKNELWATSAYYLNDSAEVIYGYDLLKKVLDDWLAKNPRPEDSLTLGLARQLRQWFGEDLLKKDAIKPIYLACFCEDDNLLSQWRAYGQSGGYSLGFNVPPNAAIAGQGFKPEPNTYTSKWARVEYDRSEQARRCHAIFDTLLMIFDDPDTARAIAAIGDHPLVGYLRILRAVTDILLEEIISFKNEAFKVEKEWRVVVRQRELTKQGTDDGGKTPLPLYFRTSQGMVVPYVKLIPTDPAKKLPIACVRTGPTLDKTIAAMGIYMMLEKNGFPHLPVRGSDISVRF